MNNQAINELIFQSFVILKCQWSVCWSDVNRCMTMDSSKCDGKKYSIETESTFSLEGKLH